MILQPEHAHPPTQEKLSLSQQLLGSLLEASGSALHPGTQNDIANIRRYFEEKVYLSYSDQPSQYLMHMLHKAKNETQDYVLGKVKERELVVLADINDLKYNLQTINEGQKIKKIRQQLTEKLHDMKTNLHGLENNSHLKQQSQQTFNKVMEFRKKGYWKQQSEQNLKVRKFLKKMKKEEKRLHASHEKLMSEKEKSLNQLQQKQSQMKQEEARQAREQKLQRLHKMKEEKEKNMQQMKKKRMEASQFVKKYKSEKPIYIINAEKFKNDYLIPMEEQKKKKLSEWKKTKKPIDAEELELHQQWYEELKQKHRGAIEKKQQDLELEERNMERLNQLFHGRFHSKLGHEGNPLKKDYDQRKKYRQKILSYSMSVRDDKKPTEDPQKKEQIENIIKLLELKKYNGKKRVEKEDGEVTFEEVTPQQRHMIGRNYLQHLRNFNASRVRKTAQDKTQSLSQLTTKPNYHDYLREQRTKTNYTGQLKSRQTLRKIASQQGYTTRERYQSAMDHFSLLQNQAKQKEIQLKYIKNNKRSMELKNQLDQYYLESAAINLQLLREAVDQD